MYLTYGIKLDAKFLMQMDFLTRQVKIWELGTKSADPHWKTISSKWSYKYYGKKWIVSEKWKCLTFGNAEVVVVEDEIKYSVISWWAREEIKEEIEMTEIAVHRG